jgi:3D (Asp-Asp-Asp) domain-containing protein
MSKPLLGGSAAAVALLSASLLFYAQPSVAETLAAASQEIQQKGGVQTAKTPGADLSPTTDAEAGVAASDTEKPNTTEKDTVKVAALAVSAASELNEEMEDTAPALSFTATAYSLRGRTASGRAVSRGVIAADRRLLPIGTRVRLEAGPYSGEYVVADTGGSVRGRKVDIWVPNAGEAIRFGRRPVRLTVLTRTRQRTASRQGRR